MHLILHHCNNNIYSLAPFFSEELGDALLFKINCPNFKYREIIEIFLKLKQEYTRTDIQINALYTCEDYTSLIERKKFFESLKHVGAEGGIYMIDDKHLPNIFLYCESVKK